MNLRVDEYAFRSYLFEGTVEASSRLTLISTLIDVPFRVRCFDAFFPVNTQALNRVSFWVSEDDEAPSTDFPTGTNLLESRGNISYVTGDSERRVIYHDVLFMERGRWLKVHAHNQDTVQHTVNATITIALYREDLLVI